MHKWIYILSFITSPCLIKAQNLVMNGGFELMGSDCTPCVHDPIPFWKSVGSNESPDFIIKSCHEFPSSSPCGYWVSGTEPCEGEGHALFGSTFVSESSNWEMIIGELTNELTFDSIYKLSFKLKVPEAVAAVSNLYIYFTEEMNIHNYSYDFIESNNYSLKITGINNFNREHLNQNWVEFNTTFKANGNEKYIAIGDAINGIDEYFLYDKNIPFYATVYYIDCLELVKISPLLCDLERGNVITPNGDGLNDVFEVKALYSKTSLYIFNRWGNLIYETNDYRNDWDAKGHPAGVYYYIFRRPNGDECKGVVTVIKDN